MKRDIVQNKCVSLEPINRLEICQSLDRINEAYPNTYDEKTKKCIPLIGEFKYPDPPLITKAEAKVIEGVNQIELTIQKPKNMGNPHATHYNIQFTNI